MAHQSMRIYWLMIIFLLSLPMRGEARPLVMSLNLCADAYLMSFAAKSQILALTPQSRDARLSASHQKAQAFPVSDGRIETIAALAPDLVIVSPYSDPLRNRLIEQLGVKLLVMDGADNFAAARTEIIALGKAIGRAPQARAYLAALDKAMQQAEAPPNDAAKPRILPLQRRNLTAGKDHIMDEIITRAGGLNEGRSHGDTVMSRVSLEHALASRAGYILLNERNGTPNSRGMEFLSHPAFAARFGPTQRLYIDNNLLVCAGATTPKAIADLRRQLAD